MRRARSIIAPLALLAPALLGSCVPPPRPVVPPPVPQAAPAPAPTPAIALGPDWNDWPRTAGEWRYTRGASNSLARFTTGVVLSCDADRRVRLWLEGRTSLSPLTVRTSSAVRAVTPAPIGEPQGGIAVVLEANDPLLDAIAFSRGRFTIEQAGAAPLVLPPHAEIGRVIEDCRG